MTPTVTSCPRIVVSCIIVLACLLPTGCGVGGSPTLSAQTALAQNGPALSNAQEAVVTDAARQMAADPAATVHGLVARSQAGVPGVHVCGYIARPTNASTPLYVELREQDGAITAERGQIGATTANLAKVRFMCRNHGDW